MKGQVKGQVGVTEEETALRLEPQAWPGLQLLCTVPACVALSVAQPLSALGSCLRNTAQVRELLRRRSTYTSGQALPALRGASQILPLPPPLPSLSRKDLSQEWVGVGEGGVGGRKLLETVSEIGSL